MNRDDCQHIKLVIRYDTRYLRALKSWRSPA